MKMIDQWRAALNKLWSVRIALLTALLALGDQMLSIYGAQLPPAVYGGLSVVFIVARLVKQA